MTFNMFQGSVEFDSAFSTLFNFSNPNILYGMKQLCEVCKVFSRNTELVKNGSAQCFPIGKLIFIKRFTMIYYNFQTQTRLFSYCGLLVS